MVLSKEKISKIITVFLILNSIVLISAIIWGAVIFRDLGNFVTNQARTNLEFDARMKCLQNKDETCKEYEYLKNKHLCDTNKDYYQKECSQAKEYLEQQVKKL